MQNADQAGMLSAQLDFIQNGRLVKRYHGLPMLDYQRIDAHSYGVAMVVRLLVGRSDHARLLRLLEAALEHDLAEWIVGDMPAPAKRMLPAYPILDGVVGEHVIGERSFREVFGEVEATVMNDIGFIAERALDKRDKRALKLADAIEGCLHCIEERRMGNAHPRLCRSFYEFWSYCTEEQGLAEPDRLEEWEDGEPAMRHHIAREWVCANGGKW